MQEQREKERVRLLLYVSITFIHRPPEIEVGEKNENMHYRCGL